MLIGGKEGGPGSEGGSPLGNRGNSVVSEVESWRVLSESSDSSVHLHFQQFSPGVEESLEFG